MSTRLWRTLIWRTLTLLFLSREHTFDVDISTHEIDGTLYIQIGGCVMSIQELRKYRQVCVSNASFLYYAEFVGFHCTIYLKVFALLQLIITLFTKSVFTISCGVGSVVSSILLILSLRIVSRWYNVIVVVSLSSNNRLGAVLLSEYVLQRCWRTVSSVLRVWLRLLSYSRPFLLSFSSFYLYRVFTAFV